MRRSVRVRLTACEFSTPRRVAPSCLLTPISLEGSDKPFSTPSFKRRPTVRNPCVGSPHFPPEGRTPSEQWRSLDRFVRVKFPFVSYSSIRGHVERAHNGALCTRQNNGRCWPTITVFRSCFTSFPTDLSSHSSLNAVDALVGVALELRTGGTTIEPAAYTGTPESVLGDQDQMLPAPNGRQIDRYNRN